MKAIDVLRQGLFGSEYWLARFAFQRGLALIYLVAFLVTEGTASLRIDPLTEQITLFPLSEKATGETKSVAIEVQRG